MISALFLAIIIRGKHGRNYEEILETIFSEIWTYFAEFEFRLLGVVTGRSQTGRGQPPRPLPSSPAPVPPPPCFRWRPRAREAREYSPAESRPGVLSSYESTGKQKQSFPQEYQEVTCLGEQ